MLLTHQHCGIQFPIELRHQTMSRKSSDRSHNVHAMSIAKVWREHAADEKGDSKGMDHASGRKPEPPKRPAPPTHGRSARDCIANKQSTSNAVGLRGTSVIRTYLGKTPGIAKDGHTGDAQWGLTSHTPAIRGKYTVKATLWASAR